MRRRWLALAVILTAPTGCDNVKWGGVDMRLEPPPTAANAPAEEPVVDPAAVVLPPLPSGPLLLVGSRDGDRATLAVVGEVRGDMVAAVRSDEEAPGFLDHFTAGLLPPGTQIVLFAGGARVGRLTVDGTGVETGYCVPRPTVTGVVELVPGATGVRDVLALLDTAAFRIPHGRFAPLNHDFDQRVATINLATATLPQVGAPVPEALVEARATLRAFQLPDAEGPTVAATFLHEDRLTVAPPEADDAYALYVMASQEGGAYRSSYVWYHPAAEGGKGIPRLLDHLDWDGNGSSEILLEVLGAERRWFAGLGRRDGAWVKTFEDPCLEAGGG